VWAHDGMWRNLEAEVATRSIPGEIQSFFITNNIFQQKKSMHIRFVDVLS
jgi:hypothetical protein